MIWYDMIWHDTIWYMIRCDVIWYMIWCDVLWYDIYGLWYAVMWYVIWYDMIYALLQFLYICYLYQIYSVFFSGKFKTKHITTPVLLQRYRATAVCTQRHLLQSRTSGLCWYSNVSNRIRIFARTIFLDRHKFLESKRRREPILASARLKAWVLGRSPAGMVSSNPTGGHRCLSFVSVVCCEVEVSATSWSLFHRSPTECDHESSVMRRPWPTGSCWAMVKTWRQIMFLRFV